MCLREIIEKLDKPVQKRFYKIMIRFQRKGQAVHYGFKTREGCRPLEKGVVRHAVGGWLTNNQFGIAYRAGFHGYTTLADAFSSMSKLACRREVIVLCTGLVHTIGYQSYQFSKVYVASTLKILKEIEPK